MGTRFVTGGGASIRVVILVLGGSEVKKGEITPVISRLHVQVRRNAGTAECLLASWGAKQLERKSF